MIIILRRRRILALLCLLLMVSAVAGAFLYRRDAAAVSAAAPGIPSTVILDAGHGGADGGAVAADGTAESGINLQITQRVGELFTFLGQRVLLTRTGEDGLYNADDRTIREKKVADTRNRVELINRVENGTLISIHQNALPSSPRVHGAQVFFNRQEGAEALAVSVQQSLNTAINDESPRLQTSIPNSVYIMAHASCPAILVECGFLSNPEEAARLQEPSHQIKLAAAIVCGYLACKG